MLTNLRIAPYTIVTNKDDINKENARIKQLLKKNGYQEIIITKSKRITNNHSLSQSQQQMKLTDVQKEEMRMSINLAYVDGTSKNLWHILRSHKIRSTFSTESTLCKLVCKPKDRVPTKKLKNNIVFEIASCNCEAVYFSESKRSLKSSSE